MLIDSHAHLDFEEYDDLDAVIARAKAAGLVHVVAVGQYPQPDRALQLARRDRAFFSATAGIHPHDAAQARAEDFDALRKLCADPDIVAVGECGLDFHYDRSPRDVQREMFVRQIKLARELKKPLVVHTREADLETADILARELGPDGGVIHCFTSDWTAAQRYLALGLSISFSGVLTFKNADALRDAAARIPLDRILVETDCPFLAPIPFRGKRNEPAHVVHTAAKLAEVKKISLSEVELATTGNARRALRLAAG
ncbi:MAG TPA: TatD family hydrolase [Myxococcales bacterium]|nr:TatD family hydrolase [Myxococcales bacterium]